MTESIKNLINDKGDQLFANLMDCVFELCEELKQYSLEDLSEAEVSLLDAMNEYVDYELEQQENENEES